MESIMGKENLINKWRKLVNSQIDTDNKYNQIEAKVFKNRSPELEKMEAELFEKINCLDCANCCKTTPTIFTESDINSICKRTNMSKKFFLENIVLKDLDGTYTSLSTPCYFLGEDNRCKIYDFRPLACRSYPHVSATKNAYMWKWQVNNTKVCPISYYFMEKICNNQSYDL